MIQALMGGMGAGAGAGAGMGGIGGADFLSWLDMFDPEMKGSMLEKLGLLEPNQTAVANNTNMQMAGLKPPQPPIPAMSPQQMMSMAQGANAMNQRSPQGLMAPPMQKPFKGRGLWG